MNIKKNKAIAAKFTEKAALRKSRELVAVVVDKQGKQVRVWRKIA